MRTALYVIWALIPLTFFVIALWSKLEDWSGRERRENVSDYLRQGAFTAACVLVCIFIDQNFLEDLVLAYAPFDLPLGFFQIMLLPMIFLLAAKLFGGSKVIRVQSMSTPKKGKKRR